jgi:hypothetical protein
LASIHYRKERRLGVRSGELWGALILRGIGIMGRRADFTTVLAYQARMGELIHRFMGKGTDEIVRLSLSPWNELRASGFVRLKAISPFVIRLPGFPHQLRRDKGAPIARLVSDILRRLFKQPHSMFCLS